MTVLTSSVPAVLNALVGASGAIRTALAPVQVEYGEPIQKAREVVWVSGTPDWDQQWAALGGRSREERYTLGLTIIAQSDAAATDHQTIVERAFELLADVETAVRGDIDLSLAGTGSSQFRSLTAEMSPASFELDWGGSNGTERFCRIEAGITVTARI